MINPKTMIFDLALAFTPYINGAVAKILIDKFFSPENIFAQSYENLRLASIAPKLAKDIAGRVAMDKAQKQLDFCINNNITIIPITSELYPFLLRETANPPCILYLMGNKELLNRNLISIIGTRKSTSYSEVACEIIIKDIARKIINPVIVSGLAFGVDSAAHRAAINHKVPTIAFLPSSLPSIVPATHAQLAQQIIDEGGAIISEAPFDTSIRKGSYILRNRLIAGSSAMTIVAESGISGGSMQTALMTYEMERPLGAIPGNISLSSCYGSNHLLATHKATAITSASDIIRVLGWSDRRIDDDDDTIEAAPMQEESDSYSESQRAVLRVLDGEAKHISEIEPLTPLSAAQLIASLMELEIMGVVKSMPGSRYCKLVNIK